MTDSPRTRLVSTEPSPRSDKEISRKKSPRSKSERKRSTPSTELKGKMTSMSRQASVVSPRSQFKPVRLKSSESMLSVETQTSIESSPRSDTTMEPTPRVQMAQYLTRKYTGEIRPTTITEWDILSDRHIIIYERDNKKLISAGTIDQIVEQLCFWLVNEANRNDVFKLVYIWILTFRRFATADQLFSIIADLWNHPSDNDGKQKSSVMFFLSCWFETQYSDFNSEKLSKRLEQFLKNMPSDYRRPLLSKIKQANLPKATPSYYLFEPSKDLSPPLVPGKFGVLDLTPEMVANQWTILDMQNILKIDRSEWFSKSHPNWDLLLRRNAEFSRWVASEIVQNQNMSKRVDTMKRFVQIALVFLENHNFNGLMSVWGGLNSVSVHRLNKTKKKLPKATANLWSSLEKKLSEVSNFSRLRQAIDKSFSKENTPVVPWFELINKMRNWAEQYDDYITLDKTDQNVSQSPSLPSDPKISGYIGPPSPFVNFGKVYILGDQLLNFEKFVKRIEEVDLTYNESPQDLLIRNYLDHLPTFSDEVLWKLSHQCEPNDTTENL